MSRFRSRSTNSTYLTGNSGRMLKGGRKTNRSLTKQDCQVRRGLNQLLHHLVGHLRYLCVFLLMQQPAEQLILVHQISWKIRITCIRYFVESLSVLVYFVSQGFYRWKIFIFSSTRAKRIRGVQFLLESFVFFFFFFFFFFFLRESDLKHYKNFTSSFRSLLLTSKIRQDFISILHLFFFFEFRAFRNFACLSRF